MRNISIFQVVFNHYSSNKKQIYLTKKQILTIIIFSLFNFSHFPILTFFLFTSAAIKRQWEHLDQILWRYASTLNKYFLCVKPLVTFMNKKSKIYYLITVSWTILKLSDEMNWKGEEKKEDVGWICCCC